MQGNTILGLLDHALVPAQYCNAQSVKLNCSKYGTNNINIQEQLTINVSFHTVRFFRVKMSKLNSFIFLTFFPKNFNLKYIQLLVSL
jgi:hypothetical protein